MGYRWWTTSDKQENDASLNRSKTARHLGGTEGSRAKGEDEGLRAEILSKILRKFSQCGCWNIISLTRFIACRGHVGAQVLPLFKSQTGNPTFKRRSHQARNSYLHRMSSSLAGNHRLDPPTSGFRWVSDSTKIVKSITKEVRISHIGRGQSHQCTSMISPVF